MLLKLENIKKEYKISKSNKQIILNDINLELSSGEFVCIYGESGSGKSTLMNIIGGLDNNYDGKVKIDDVSIKELDLDNYRRDKIGFVFQNFNLIPYLTVFENVMLMLDMVKLKEKEKIKKTKEALRKVGLIKHSHKKPNELSGGMKQRVALARAIINEPDIILADEPTGALDKKNANKVLNMLKNLSLEGKLVIVVTHSNNVKKFANKIITLDSGKIIKFNNICDNKIDKKSSKTLKRSLNSSICIKLGINNIFKNIKRNILIIIASSIGVIGILISLYVGSGVKKYINDEIKNNIDPLSFNITEKGKNELYDIKYYSESEISKIKKIKHIKNIVKNVSYSSAYIIYKNKKYDLVSLSSYTNMNEKNIKKGNILKDNDIVFSEYLENNIDGNVIDNYVSLYLLDTSNLEPKMISDDLKVSGIYKNGKIDLLNNSNYAYVKYETLEKIYNDYDMKLKPTELKIEIDNKNNIEYVKKEIKKLGYELSNMQDYTNTIFDYLDIATFIISSFSFISLIVSIIMIITIFNINVLERTKEIGIFRAIGFRKKDIKRIFKTEAILIGFLTGISSSYFSIIISKLIKKVTISKFNVDLLNVEFKYIIYGLIISIIVCFAGSMYPSNKASKLNIVDALRYE
jgi:putative ABC transport system permease protein